MKHSENHISGSKLIYRTKVKVSDQPRVKASNDDFELFMKTWDQGSIEHVEEFKLMLLNRSNRVLGIAEISKEGLSGTVTDVRVILQYVIKSNASGIIVCHKHPSGNLQPSESDSNLTNKIKKAVGLLYVQLLDHLIIIPEEKYYNMADEGIV